MKANIHLLVFFFCTWLLANPPANAQHFVEVHQDGVTGVDGLANVRSVAISPDEAFVYACGFFDASIAIFSRNFGGGELTYLGRVQNGVDGVQGLNGVNDIKLSPDGLFLYAAGYNDNAISVFSRNPMTGELAWLQTIGGLSGAVNCTVSPDGKNVYLAVFFANELHVYDRNATTGLLTFLELHTVVPVNAQFNQWGLIDLACSPDGAHLYVGGYYESSVRTYSRNAATGSLTPASMVQDGVGGVDGLSGAYYLAVSPDGKNLYCTGYQDNALAVFNRNAGDGSLGFSSALFDGTGGVEGIQGATGVAVSGDGNRVFVAGSAENALQGFHRNNVSGSLVSARTAREGVLGVQGLTSPFKMAATAAGCQIYVACPGGNTLVLLQSDSINWHEDTDGDGYGNPDVAGISCYQPTGFVTDDSDCNDNDDNVNTSATEVCNGLDDNCNGQVDENGGCTYCPSSGTNSQQEWIKKVKFTNQINNNSGNNGGYADFTALSANVEQGKDYNLKLKPDFNQGKRTVHWRVWIDFNQDLDFDDPGEKVFQDSDDEQVEGEIGIPNSALLGSTRMRVSMKRNNYPTPCEQFNRGEVEEYTLVIASNAGGGGNGDRAASLYFSAMQAAQAVELYGICSDSEKPIARLIFERSADEDDYLPFAEFAAAPGEATSFARARDDSPLEGLNFYRLQVHFADGSSAWSEPQVVVFQSVPDLSLFPNPASESVWLFSGKFTGIPAIVRIQDPLGRQVFEQHFAELPGGEVRLPVQDLVEGLYSVTVQAEGWRLQTRRLVVAKSR